MEPFTVFFAFVAGVLSFLNPCVLPLLPIVFATAASTHRLGSVAMTTGLIVSFMAFGMFVAVLGFSLGYDGISLQTVAAIMLVAIGLVLMAPPLQARLALAAAPIVNRADRYIGEFATGGLTGQFGLGVLLGIVWTPCVGPTLGAASVLAAQGRDLGGVAATMSVFALGAALPLVLFGLASRRAVTVWQGHLLSVAGRAKTAFGIVLVLTGVLILTGYDKRLEAALLSTSPGWLSDVTTRF
jgi:cytochrome c biogenesis protein CcdA